jgi:hypothetical protein
MSGGKGGRASTSVQIPEWLESAARQNIARADQIAQTGYVPYYGPDVAAMTPMQMAAGGNINAAASAFGLGAPTSATAGMPPAMDYGGMGAYSSAPLYEQSLAELQARRPGQFAALQAPFIDPVTGAAPASPFGSNLALGNQAPIVQSGLIASAGGGDRGDGMGDFAGAGGRSGGGYTGLRDMFDGGGPGRSGDTFEGGGRVSNIGNALGGPMSRDGDGGMGGRK